MDLSLDPAIVRQLAKMAGSTYGRIAELLGVSIYEIRQFMTIHKISLSKRVTLEISNPALCQYTVRMLALETRASYRSIARKIGVSHHTIIRFMMKHNISLAHPYYRSAEIHALQQGCSDSSDRISVLSLLNP